jgi:hemoglobin
MTETLDAPSQWERVGGGEAVAAVLDRFYVQILDEPQLAGFFENVNVDDIKPHLSSVLEVVLGGPEAPTGIDVGAYLTKAHSGLGVSASDYAMTGEILIGVLKEFDVPQDIIDTIATTLEAVSAFVIESQ